MAPCVSWAKIPHVAVWMSELKSSPRSISNTSAPASFNWRTTSRNRSPTSGSTNSKSCQGRERQAELRRSWSSARRTRQSDRRSRLGPTVCNPQRYVRIHPWYRVWEIGATPLRGQRPVVGLNPTTPHSDAGTRMDPTVSPPKEAGTIPAATEAAEPLDDPPVTRSKARGFLTWPKRSLCPVSP